MSNSLDTLLTQHLKEAPDRVVFDFLDDQGEPAESLDFRTLHAQASALAQHLRHRHRGNEPVLVVAGPGSEHAVSLFACFLAGLTAAPVYPPQAAKRQSDINTIASIARTSQARLLLATEGVASDLLAALSAELADDTPEWVDVALSKTPPPGDLALPGSSPTQAALLLFTSGSTGAPKGVVVTHEAILHNLRALKESCQRSSDDVVCSWMPQSHIAGLFFRLMPVVFGARGVYMPVQAFITNPTNWLRAISRHGATITVAPDFAYAITARIWVEASRTRPELEGLFDLTSLSMAISGGELVRSSTLTAFTEAFASCGFDGDSFCPYYGLTETLCTSISQGEPLAEVTISRQGALDHTVSPARDEADRLVLMGNGAPVGDTQLLIVDPATRLPAGQNAIGEIWVRGTAVTPGYIGQSTTAPAWQGQLATEPADAQPFFRTGDLGFVQQGPVFITGRLKELVIIRGKNHYPLDIEGTVMEHAGAMGVLQCAAFGVRIGNAEETLGLALELAEGERDTELEPAVRAAVTTQHGLSIEHLFVMPKGTMPCTATQKIARLACARLAQSHEWASFALSVPRTRPASPSQPPGGAGTKASNFVGLSGPALEGVVLGQIITLLAKHKDVRLDGASLDRPLAALGMSSLHLAQFTADLRTALAIGLPIAALFDSPSLRALAHTCAKQIEGAESTATSIEWQATVKRLNAVLPPDIGALPRSEHQGILLTGATGFLGSWLLHALLTLTQRPIVCLVRSESTAHGLRRVQGALEHGPGWKPEYAHRLAIATGDLRSPGLGLSAADHHALAAQVGCVVHNAADVNFVASYQALADSNVEPLREILALAVDGAQRRTVHYVSTTAVFNAPGLLSTTTLRAQDLPESPEHVYSGYAQTKWVSEAVLREATRRGLPVHIHRPSLIVGDSHSGQSHTDDLVCRIIKGCVQLGRYPDADITLNTIAVDQVAGAIAATIAAADPPPVMHWSAPKQLAVKAAVNVLTERGHALQPQSMASWLASLRESLPLDNAMYPIQDFLLQRIGGTDKTLLEVFDGHPIRVDVDESVAFAAQSGFEVTPSPVASFAAMATWMESTGYLPRTA